MEVHRVSLDSSLQGISFWSITVEIFQIRDLNLGIIDILDQIYSCLGVGDGPIFCGIFSSIFVLYPLDPSKTHQFVTIKKCLQTLSNIP